uniref:RabBD domain-containing protein n=1 Tax=Macrostomum lignano TaxID=282301 RepID=A0A1I8GAM8_9PLAT
MAAQKELSDQRSAESVLVKIHFLTDQEKETVVEVLQRNEKIRKHEADRKRRLQQELERLESSCAASQSPLAALTQSCPRCDAALALLVRGACDCFLCRLSVCKSCAHLFRDSQLCLCSVCYQKLLYESKIGNWMNLKSVMIAAESSVAAAAEDRTADSGDLLSGLMVKLSGTSTGADKDAAAGDESSVSVGMAATPPAPTPVRQWEQPAATYRVYQVSTRRFADSPPPRQVEKDDEEATGAADEAESEAEEEQELSIEERMRRHLEGSPDIVQRLWEHQAKCEASLTSSNDTKNESAAVEEETIVCVTSERAHSEMPKRNENYSSDDEVELDQQGGEVIPADADDLTLVDEQAGQISHPTDMSEATGSQLGEAGAFSSADQNLETSELSSELTLTTSAEQRPTVPVCGSIQLTNKDFDSTEFFSDQAESTEPFDAEADKTFAVRDRQKNFETSSEELNFTDAPVEVTVVVETSQETMEGDYEVSFQRESSVTLVQDSDDRAETTEQVSQNLVSYEIEQVSGSEGQPAVELLVVDEKQSLYPLTSAPNVGSTPGTAHSMFFDSFKKANPRQDAQENQTLLCLEGGPSKQLPDAEIHDKVEEVRVSQEPVIEFNPSDSAENLATLEQSDKEASGNSDELSNVLNQCENSEEVVRGPSNKQNLAKNNRNGAGATDALDSSLQAVQGDYERPVHRFASVALAEDQEERPEILDEISHHLVSVAEWRLKIEDGDRDDESRLEQLASALVAVEEERVDCTFSNESNNRKTFVELPYNYTGSAEALTSVLLDTLNCEQEVEHPDSSSYSLSRTTGQHAETLAKLAESLEATETVDDTPVNVGRCAVFSTRDETSKALDKVLDSMQSLLPEEDTEEVAAPAGSYLVDNPDPDAAAQLLSNLADAMDDSSEKPVPPDRALCKCDSGRFVLEEAAAQLESLLDDSDIVLPSKSSDALVDPVFDEEQVQPPQGAADGAPPAFDPGHRSPEDRSPPEPIGVVGQFEPPSLTTLPDFGLDEDIETRDEPKVKEEDETKDWLQEAAELPGAVQGSSDYEAEKAGESGAASPEQSSGCIDLATTGQASPAVQPEFVIVADSEGPSTAKGEAAAVQLGMQLGIGDPDATTSGRRSPMWMPPQPPRSPTAMSRLELELLDRSVFFPRVRSAEDVGSSSDSAGQQEEASKDSDGDDDDSWVDPHEYRPSKRSHYNPIVPRLDLGDLSRSLSCEANIDSAGSDEPATPMAPRAPPAAVRELAAAAAAAAAARTP